MCYPEGALETMSQPEPKLGFGAIIPKTRWARQGGRDGVMQGGGASGNMRDELSFPF